MKEEKRLRNTVEPKDEQTSQNKPAEPVESLQEEQKNAEITIVN